MNDFQSLNAVVTGSSVALTWSLAGLPVVGFLTNFVSAVLLRSPLGYENYSVVTTITDRTVTSYTDTLPATGQYQYKLHVTAGTGQNLQTLESNVISASNLSSVTLTGSVSGRQLTLSWTTGTAGEENVDDTLVQISTDGGTTWKTRHNVSGGLAPTFVQEFLPGTYSFRVLVSVESPEIPDAATESNDRQITSNTVTVTIS